jgi:transposase
MRQVHRAGEKLFVDFSGKRPHLIDPTTGEEVAVELFVGVLGASGLIYAEATRTQDLPSWIGAHIRMLEYVQGSPAVWVPDQLKSGVTTASRYEPEINRTTADLARHYGAVVIPARPATPTDKPLVEVSVQIAQRSLVFLGFRRCLGTNGPKFGPKLLPPSMRMLKPPRRCHSYSANISCRRSKTARTVSPSSCPSGFTSRSTSIVRS